MTIVTITLPFTISEIFANQIKRQKFDLENEDLCERGDKLDFPLFINWKCTIL